MLRSGPVIGGGGGFIQRCQRDELGTAFHNVAADAVEIFPGIPLAKITDQHYHGAVRRRDKRLAVAEGTGDVGPASQLDAHQGLHRVVHVAAEIHH